jgi:hypothetical protein
MVIAAVVVAAKPALRVNRAAEFATPGVIASIRNRSE